MSDENEMVTTEVIDSSIKVMIHSEMTIYTAEPLFNELLDRWKSITDMPEHFDVDLSGVGEMDSSGFQILSLFKRECEHRKCKLRLSAVSDNIRETFELLGAEKYFAMH